MKKLVCNSCGASLTNIEFNEYKCEYCGATYIENEHTYRLEMCREPIHTLCAEVCVSEFMQDNFPIDTITDYYTQHLIKKLSEGIAACIKVDIRKDPTLQATIIRGEVRIVPPEFRF